MSKFLIKRTPGPYETDTARIYLTSSVFCLVSSCDYEWLSRYKWRLDNTGYNLYAYRRYTVKSRTHTIKMHREIMNCPDDMETHHTDLNGLNNCRSNLVNLSQVDHRLAHGKSR